MRTDEHRVRHPDHGPGAVAAAAQQVGHHALDVNDVLGLVDDFLYRLGERDAQLLYSVKRYRTAIQTRKQTKLLYSVFKLPMSCIALN